VGSKKLEKADFVKMTISAAVCVHVCACVLIVLLVVKRNTNKDLHTHANTLSLSHTYVHTYTHTPVGPKWQNNVTMQVKKSAFEKVGCKERKK
jgi:hypothetical protein